MPRPRKVSDDDVFAASARAMTRFGPGELTLAEIAAEAGLTAGALVQRFGSKRELLLRLSARAVDGNAAYIRGLRAKHHSPLAALREYAGCLANLAASPAALARNLAYLQIDLTDPEFRAHLLAQAKATRAAIAELLVDAATEGELAPAANTRKLARAVETALSGSLMTWAVYRDGAAGKWLRDDLDAALAPYLAKRRRR